MTEYYKVNKVFNEPQFNDVDGEDTRNDPEIGPNLDFPPWYFFFKTQFLSYLKLWKHVKTF